MNIGKEDCGKIPEKRSVLMGLFIRDMHFV
jgi:hypothetical protein